MAQIKQTTKDQGKKKKHWTCEMCTWMNPSTKQRCELCNTPQNYNELHQQRVKSVIDKINAKYKTNNTDDNNTILITDKDGNKFKIDEIISWFYPYPDMNGCNKGQTALSCIIDETSNNTQFGLYLSGSHIATNYITQVKANHFTHIINCASTDIKHDLIKLEKECGIPKENILQLPINDVSKDKHKMKQHLDNTLKFLDNIAIAEAIEDGVNDIQENKENNDVSENKDNMGNKDKNTEIDVKDKSKCLIHCSAGVSRSSTVVIAWLMKQNKWSLVKSFQHCRKQRKYIYPNLGFWNVLIEYEVTLFGKKNSSIDSDFLQLHAEAKALQVQ